MAKKEKASKNGPLPMEGQTPQSTWQRYQTDTGHHKPWEAGQHATAEVLRMYAQEAKACFYDILRDHVELFYNATGWPANHKEWEPLVKERDDLFLTDEQAPDSDGVGVRYGLTYAALRWAFDEVQDNGWVVIPVRCGPFTTEAEFAGYWVRMWVVHYLHKVVRPFLVRHKYSEAIGVELQAAFADLHEFEMGQGSGARVWRKLKKDEQGRNAVAAFQKNRERFTKELHLLLAEPFGIERDFKHLMDTAWLCFGLQLQESIIGIFKHFQQQELVNQYQLHDTLGMEPYALYKEATSASGGTFRLSVWVPLYLERIKSIVYRWIDNGQRERVDEQLVKLTQELKALDPVPGQGTPKDRTDIERATREIVEGIEELRGKVPMGPNSPTPVLLTETRKTGTSEKPKRPTLADQLGQVPGAAERFMGLVRRAGLCDASGQWIADNDVKGKGKLIAAWDAVVEVLKVPGFGTDTALAAALKEHFPGLEGLDRLDRVRDRKHYGERVEEYMADLEETK